MLLTDKEYNSKIGDSRLPPLKILIFKTWNAGWILQPLGDFSVKATSLIFFITWNGS